jgi:hypothetical protein
MISTSSSDRDDSRESRDELGLGGDGTKTTDGERSRADRFFRGSAIDLDAPAMSKAREGGTVRLGAGLGGVGMISTGENLRVTGSPYSGTAVEDDASEDKGET